MKFKAFPLMSDDPLEDKVVDIFHSLNINLSEHDIEDCHRLGKAESKNTIVRFVNRKFCYVETKLGFQAGAILYFSENLTHYNQRLAWKCKELKRARKSHSSWSSKGIVKLRHTMNERPISTMHDSDIIGLYPDFVFKERQNQRGNR